ncbi:conjugal transfer protein [Thermoactinospora rubra]|uniref:conjugal transfer protein n=1 Tax=Thermoactinospora rubra TaxID=1088767 RepID=UPI000A0F476A|nr:conjugal transfer protein [Thermoactinospora rubra]
MDLPTYTNIWRIEKRLYKLYDLRLPMPLPIVWIGVFVGVLAPWSFLLWLVGIDFEAPWHVLYLVPPGIVTWLSTRPVIEGKRLTELLQSQLRYIGEPRVWCRLAPSAEPETITFTARVWRALPPKPSRKALRAERAAQAVKPRESGESRETRKAREARKAREVRPAVAAAAAAVAQAPVTSGTVRPASGSRRGVPPALGVPVVEQVAVRPANGSASERPSGEAARPETSGNETPRSDAARPDAAQTKPAAGRPSTHETPVAKPIDTEALRRLRKLAASAQVEPSRPEPPPAAARSDAEDQARLQHRRGQPPRQVPSVRPVQAQPVWPSQEKPVTRPLTQHAPGDVRPLRAVPDAPPPAAETQPPATPDAAPAPQPSASAGTAQDHTAEERAPDLAQERVAHGAPEHVAEAAERHAPGTAQSAAERAEEPAPGVAQEASDADHERLATAAEPGTPVAQRGEAAGPMVQRAEAAAWVAQPAEAASVSARPPVAEGSEANAAKAGETSGAGEDAEHGGTEGPVTELKAPRDEATAAARAGAPAGESAAEADQPAPAPAPQADRPAPVPAPQADRRPPVPGPRAGEPKVRRVESVVGRDTSGGWRRIAQVVVGNTNVRGDGSEIDEARTRAVFSGSRRIVVLGCTGGAGQSTTALMLGHTLAAHRDDRVLAVDASTGGQTLTSRIQAESPETLTSLLSGLDGVTGYLTMRAYTTRTPSGLEVVSADSDAGAEQRLADRTLLSDHRLGRLMGLLDRHYKLTVVDPAPALAARVLPYADQLVLVVPASEDGAEAVGMTYDWLDGHGCADLRRRAVMVVNGVSRRTMDDVEQAEAVARGRCRAIVRVPWEDELAAGGEPVEPERLRTAGRRAYLALAGVVVAGFAAAQTPPSSERELAGDPPGTRIGER